MLLYALSLQSQRGKYGNNRLFAYFWFSFYKYGGTFGGKGGGFLIIVSMRKRQLLLPFFNTSFEFIVGLMYTIILERTFVINILSYLRIQLYMYIKFIPLATRHFCLSLKASAVVFRPQNCKVHLNQTAIQYVETCVTLKHFTDTNMTPLGNK